MSKMSVNYGNLLLLLLIPLLLKSVEATSSFQANSASSTSSSSSSPEEELSSLIKTFEPADILNGSAGQNGLFLLIPSNINLTDILKDDSDFSLFKLNTDVLFGRAGSITRKKRSYRGGLMNDDLSKQALESSEGSRMPRKINLFRGLFNKPRYSPLYLVNGTVCRFVNTGPICTTISTNGLPGLNQQQPFQNPAQQQQPFQNQGQFNNNQQQQLFNNNQQQQQPQPAFNSNQQLRPAGLMDDDTPSINVSGINNNNITSNTGSRLFKSTPNQQQQQSNASSVLSRRPSQSLLSLGRPMRQFINSPSNLVSTSNRRDNNNRIIIKGGRISD